MGPEHLKFGGGVSQSVVNPLVLVFVLIAGLLICFGPRNKAIVPFLIASFLIPMDQILLIGSLHFPMLRILILFGLIRICWTKVTSGGEIFSGGVNKIDVAVILLSVFTAVNGILLWNASGAVIYQVGVLYTVFGIYFLLRFLVRDEEDVQRVIRTFVYIAAVMAVIMVYEQTTGRNPIYGLLGGARTTVYESVLERDGRFRAAGSFSHPILAGTFGAILLPLFFGLWWRDKKRRKTAVLGMIAATVITVASASSTPILAYVAGLAGLCAWPLRKRMRLIRWGIVLALISLHMVMNGPVWNLISRLDVVGGSSGYHRQELVNLFILHFRDWWLLGVKDTSQWGWDMWDTANQYVSTGENSGLLPFVLFLAVIVYGFKYLGVARRAAQENKKAELFLWSLWAALLANVVAFFGISYWDQTQVAWYALLAIIAAATKVAPATSPGTGLAQTYPDKLVRALTPRHESKTSGALNSYGRIGSGRWSTK